MSEYESYHSEDDFLSWNDASSSVHRPNDAQSVARTNMRARTLRPSSSLFSRADRKSNDSGSDASPRHEDAIWNMDGEGEVDSTESTRVFEEDGKRSTILPSMISRKDSSGTKPPQILEEDDVRHTQEFYLGGDDSEGVRASRASRKAESSTARSLETSGPGEAVDERNASDTDGDAALMDTEVRVRPTISTTISAFVTAQKKKRVLGMTNECRLSGFRRAGVQAKEPWGREARREVAYTTAFGSAGVWDESAGPQIAPVHGPIPSGVAHFLTRNAQWMAHNAEKRSHAVAQAQKDIDEQVEEAQDIMAKRRKKQLNTTLQKKTIKEVLADFSMRVKADLQKTARKRRRKIKLMEKALVKDCAWEQRGAVKPPCKLRAQDDSEAKLQRSTAKLAKARIAKAERELDGCTFHPAICARSERLALRALNRRDERMERGVLMRTKAWQTGMWREADFPLYPLFPAVLPRKKNRFQFEAPTRPRVPAAPITTVSRANPIITALERRDSRQCLHCDRPTNHRVL